MKKIKAIAALFAIAGLLLALGTVGLSLQQLDSAPVLVAASEDAAAAAQELMDALAQGDFSKAETSAWPTS